MKKLFLFCFAVAVLGVAVYFSLGVLVEKTSRRALRELAAQGEERGIRVLDAGFQESGFGFSKGVYWRNVAVALRPEDTSVPYLRGDAAIRVREVTLRLESLSARTVKVRAKGIEIEAGKEETPTTEADRFPPSRITGDEASVTFRLASLSLRQVRSDIKDAVEEIKDFARHGRCALPVTFSGTATFPVKGKMFEVVLSVQRAVDEWILAMGERDVVAMSMEFDLEKPLTEAEIALLSRHPLKAPRLLQFRAYARDKAQKANKADSKVPEDAYRHVLWSYLLTKEYGEEFAEKVTNAHEEGMTGNTREEKEMDLSNNAVGRRCAKLDYRESRILRVVMTYPDVIRRPGQEVP